MRVGTVEVPGSRAFLLGTLITFAIVALAGILTALPLPVVGLIVFVGWAIGLVAGAVGGGYTARSAGVESGGDGAKVGTLVGGLGNALGAVVGILALVVSALVGFEETTIPSQSPGAPPTTVGSEEVLLAVVLVGGIGLVTGTIMALIGGAIGGYVSTRL